MTPTAYRRHLLTTRGMEELSAHTSLLSRLELRMVEVVTDEV